MWKTATRYNSSQNYFLKKSWSIAAGLLKEVFPHLNSWRTSKNWTTTSVLEATGSYAALTIQSTSLWHWPLGLCWNWFFLQKFKIVLLFRSARKTLKKKISSQNIFFPRIRSLAWPIPALKCSSKFQLNCVLFLLPLWHGKKIYLGMILSNGMVRLSQWCIYENFHSQKYHLPLWTFRKAIKIWWNCCIDHMLTKTTEMLFKNTLRNFPETDNCKH